MSDTKKVQVTFTEDQWKLIKKLKGTFGDSNADVVRSIVLAWLAEKSFVSEVVKEKTDTTNMSQLKEIDIENKEEE